MAYPVIPSRRIPYDIDGSAIGYTPERAASVATILEEPPSLWLDPTALANSNSSSFSGWALRFNPSRARGLYVFFTELKEITHWLVKSYEYDKTFSSVLIQGSADTTNGSDGIWETGIYSLQHSYNIHHLRERIMAISFSGPVKAIRIGMRGSSHFDLAGLHFYGFKYTTETPDDILFVDAETGNNFVNLMDWGDRPEGTTQYKSFKMKNSSPDKIANNVNLQLNHSDFVMSFNPSGPWTSLLDIASLGVGASSATIYLKNELAPPHLTLGPETNARIIATVGSWT